MLSTLGLDTATPTCPGATGLSLESPGIWDLKQKSHSPTSTGQFQFEHSRAQSQSALPILGAVLSRSPSQTPRATVCFQLWFTLLGRSICFNL